MVIQEAMLASRAGWTNTTNAQACVTGPKPQFVTNSIPSITKTVVLVSYSFSSLQLSHKPIYNAIVYLCPFMKIAYEWLFLTMVPCWSREKVVQAYGYMNSYMYSTFGISFLVLAHRPDSWDVFYFSNPSTMIDILNISFKITLRWISQSPSDDKSALVQVIACGVRQQATTRTKVGHAMWRHMASRDDMGSNKPIPVVLRLYGYTWGVLQYHDAILLV